MFQYWSKNARKMNSIHDNCVWSCQVFKRIENVAGSQKVKRPTLTF